MIEEDGMADRGTFVIDPDGKIQLVEINAGGIGRNAVELLRKVRAAQYVAAHPNEVCLAEGKRATTPSHPPSIWSARSNTRFAASGSASLGPDAARFSSLPRRTANTRSPPCLTPPSQRN